MSPLYVLFSFLTGCLLFAPDLASSGQVRTSGDSVPVSEASQNAMQTEGAGHDAVVRDAKASRRLERPTSRTPSPPARLISQCQSSKPILTSFSQCDAPARELDNRNGVGAPLRC